MSIILKGIDIPKEWYIPMRIYANGHIWINGSYKGVAIQIPKEHGDIKDAGKLEDELDLRCGQLSAEIVRNAPTILEEEK